MSDWRKLPKIYKLWSMAHCLVSYVDMDGIRHTVEVEATTMYEAAATGISQFRKHDVSPAGQAQLEIEIRSSIFHAVTVSQLEKWLSTTPRTPKEMATKERLRALVGSSRPLNELTN